MKLKKRVNKLEEELNKKSKIINFLCNHNKDDVVITQQGNYASPTIFGIKPTPYSKTIVYIYGGELHEVNVSYLFNRKLTVLKNMETEVLMGIARCDDSHYKPFILNKAAETLTEISDEVWEQLKAMYKKEAAAIKYSTGGGFVSIGD